MYNGTDNSTCRNGSVPCATLAYALEELDSDTMVLLDNEVTSHFNITTVQGPISNITLSSSHGKSVINCSEEGGFAFINVTELTIVNVELRGCGVPRNSTSYDRYGRSTPYSMSLYLYNCIDVSLISINVSYSPGAGVVMLAVTGQVNVIDSFFIHNGFRIMRNGSLGNGYALIGRLAGGGLKIELPSCPPGVNSVDCNGNNDICPSEGSLLPNYTDVAYNIENCSFISNTAEAPNFDIYRFSKFPDTSYFTTIGRGGGVSIVVKGVSHGISIAVTSCHFEDNWSLYGAGLFMELWHRPDNVSLAITDSNFTHNHLPYSSLQNIGTGGGGMRYAHQYCPEHQREGNTIFISGCNFIDNKAYWGGGVSLVLLPQQNSQTGDTVLFQNSSFVGNVARIGAAIDFFPKLKGTSQAMLQDMQFINNSVKYADEQSHINGEGIVYIDSTTLYVKSSLNVLHNQGNGISSLYGTVQFLTDSTSLFYDNNAYRGAALALYSDAAIVLHNGSQLNFTENNSETVGGAIYHAALGNRAIPFSGSCAIQLANGLTDWDDTDITLHFNNNAALQQGRGNAIYVSSIFPCLQNSLDELNDTFKWRPFHYDCDNVTYPDCMSLQVSGDGSIVESTENTSLFITAFPGEYAPLPFFIEDDLHNKVRIHFQGEVYYNTSSYSVDILRGRNVFVTGLPKKNATLVLHSIESQTLNVQLQLNVTDCPPGFLLKENGEGVWTCQCARDLSVSIGMRCFESSKTSKLDSHYWVGYLMGDNNSNSSIGFQTGYCAPGYCRGSLTLNGSDHYNSTSLDEKVCGPQNRTGVLCGKCQDGYGVSLLLNNYLQCVPCDNPSPAKTFKVVAIWFFTEFVPLNVLFILFIVFNVNILSGWGGALYGVIFYFQIVPSTPAFQYQAPSSTDELSATDWYGWCLYFNSFLSNLWNLMFFSSFTPPKDSCIDTTATVQLATLVTYLQILVWPLIVFTCLIAIHKCYRKGRCCRAAHQCLFIMGKSLAKCQHSEGGQVNSLAGMCSFFVLAYTRLVILTSEIFMKAKITTFSNSSGPKDHYVFLYNGTVPWFDRTLHAPYAVPIMLCSFVTVLIPTLLLISFPLVPKLLEKLKLNDRRPFCWIISLLSTSYPKFLFDIFQGCFKPNARYFAALYLIYRHLFVIAWAYTTTLMSYSLWQTIIGVIFIILHLLAQPFERPAVNRITGLVMANLTLVIILAQYSILAESDQDIDSLATATKVFTILLLYIPHLGVAILFTWVTSRFIYHRIRQRCATDGAAHQGTSEGHGSRHHGNDDDWDAMRHLFERTSSGWENSEDHGEGYAQLEEEEEEDREGSIAGRRKEELQIQEQRHTTKTGRKEHYGYGSLGSSKTQ